MRNDLKQIDQELILETNEVYEFEEKIQIHVDGRKYKTKFTKKYANRKPWKEADTNEVLSIIPGSVTEIFVKKGDKVKKGEKLMIYEAMKMKNIIVAPFDATVDLINVKEGLKLPKGHLLVYLKPE